MKLLLLALAIMPAVAAAQTLPSSIQASRVLIAPNQRPNLIVRPACMLAAPARGAAIIGEDGSQIIGEDGTAPAAFAGRWNASGFTTFKHVLVGPPGRAKLSLYGCSSASGGETVSVYLAGANGERKLGWRQFVIATRNGNMKTGPINLPKAAPGQSFGRLPIVVVVENASGKSNIGEYRLTVSP